MHVPPFFQEIKVVFKVKQKPYWAKDNKAHADLDEFQICIKE